MYNLFKIKMVHMKAKMMMHYDSIIMLHTPSYIHSVLRLPARRNEGYIKETAL